MDHVLFIVIVTALVIYPKRYIFVDKFVLALKVIGLHLEISAKEKSAPPSESDRSTRKK